jgi:hypothetical protein
MKKKPSRHVLIMAVDNNIPVFVTRVIGEIGERPAVKEAGLVAESHDAFNKRVL